VTQNLSSCEFSSAIGSVTTQEKYGAVTRDHVQGGLGIGFFGGFLGTRLGRFASDWIDGGAGRMSLFGGGKLNKVKYSFEKPKVDLETILCQMVLNLSSRHLLSTGLTARAAYILADFCTVMLDENIFTPRAFVDHKSRHEYLQLQLYGRKDIYRHQNSCP
jgi:hypothetical protein